MVHQNANAIPKLELQGISQSFPASGSSGTVQVLQDVSLTVGPGEFVSIIGPSGSGKSTIFHIAGGLLTPDRGEVRMDGRPVTGQQGLISFMPQQAALFPWRSALDNIMLAQEVAGTATKASRLEAAEWMRRVGLEGYEKAYPHKLSGGMQQRVSFLRALMAPQELMCLDEPFGALDALTRLQMQEWLTKVWEETRRSVLLVTHSMEEALFLSDRVYVLSDKPTVVLRELVVPLPRPRRMEMMSDPAFLGLRQEIYDTLTQGVR